MATHRRGRENAVRKQDHAPLPIEPLEGRILFSQPPLTVQPPSAYLDLCPNITAAGGTNIDVNVQYSDSAEFNFNSFANGNITVTGPGGALTPISVTVNDASSTNNYVNVDYLFAAPGGAWGEADNGAYTVATSSTDAVSDADSQAVPPLTLGTFRSLIGQDDPGFPNTVIGDFSAQAVVPLAYNAYGVVGSEPDGSGIQGQTQLVVAKYDNGAPINGDNGAAGQIALQFGASSAGYGVAVQNNGDFVIAGTANDPGTNDTNFTVFRTGPDGLPDPAFGQDLNDDGVPDGVETVDVGGTDSVAYADALQDDGGIIAVGTTSTTGNGNFVIARIDPDNGQLDTSFGTSSGYTTTDFGSASAAGAVVIQPDGNILVAGIAGSSVVLARYDVSGQLDTSFGDNGTVTVPGLSAANWKVGLALQSNGQILVAAGDSTGTAFGVARLNSNGSVDTTFGSAGVQTVQAGGAGIASSIVVQAGGQIDVGGVVSVGANDYSALATLGSTGQLQDSFSGSPFTTFSPTSNASGTLTATSAMCAYPGGIVFAQTVGAGVNQLNGGNNQLNSQITDNLPPAASLAPTTVTAATASASFTITYTDSVGLDADTVGTGNITVSDGNESLAVTAADADSSSPGVIAVTYTVAAPTGTFTSADNGAYAVALAPQVANIAGNTVVANSDLGALTISEPAPPTPPPSPDPTPTPPDPSPTPLGSFGTVSGSKKAQKLTVSVNGVPTTFAVTNGSGQAYLNGTDLDLTVTSATGKKAAVTVTPKGGRVTLGDVTVTGSLSTFTAPAADLAGTFYISGSASTVTLGNLTNATFDAAFTLGTFKAISLTNSELLDGVQAGPGGTLDSGASYGAGVIDTVSIAGSINSSVIAAGANPVDGTFGDGDDTLAGAGSMIKTITAKGGTTGTTLIESGAIKSASLPKKIKSIASDSRFKILT